MVIDKLKVLKGEQQDKKEQTELKKKKDDFISALNHQNTEKHWLNEISKQETLKEKMET